MERNSLLRYMMVAFFCLLLIALSSADRIVTAQSATTQGSLTAVNANGQPAAECPLKHTQVKAEITGFLARVTVTQQFENPASDKIEAVYTFPLPQAAAVDDMTIVVGDRTVKGKIMSREDAQATYDAAKAKGQITGLLHQERPNIFTQSVANILPGQQVTVTISYVETLKYDEGFYEWSFPMVVGARYIPGAETQSSEPPDAEPPPRVLDAGRISPPVMAAGVRAGHDISIEVMLDAGVPVVGLESETHPIEAIQPDYRKAVVCLKDQATIPNKDFTLKYGVAGNRIEDALLMHRDTRGGFFTFILQPPQRVTAADTMPKELVFVLDTSGSMEGFPLDKAKETMKLALDGLYPQDTFNVITFAGDTRILFSEPVPASPENLNKAKRLLAHTKSEGGTEMMKAIRAALAPSDAQDHVRIVCFLTDGQVGNDMEIIAEVQKHPNVRVFAMGFSGAPNRFLLDKITEYGRGEVEYVTEGSDAAKAATRFHERIRNPLLTDVVIDWGGLPVSDVYPKSIPDLFSAKPVVISGRYSAGARGTIRLKGRASGQESVREIAVEFPQVETQHDVLATLWARRKVDDLMGQDMGGAQTGKMRDELKTEITTLGLAYRMMTQFTSFVAVDESAATGGSEPRRVDVPVETPAGSGCGPAGVCATVTVSAAATTSMDSAYDYATTRTIQSLPIYRRSVQGLVMLAPGTAAPGPAQGATQTPVNLAVNGQRPTENQFTIDGVSGNFGIAPGGQSPGASAAGSVPALTATGGAQPITTISSVQEISIHSHSPTAEFGGYTGATVSIVTQSGTNSFHGSLFQTFSHELLDASDWFANSRALAKPRHRMMDFGGTIGGPIKRDQWFFFTSYEGTRLRQPVVGLTDVPSLGARNNAALNVQPLLKLFPLPNGIEGTDGFAEFASGFANRGGHDAASWRIDGLPTQNLALTFYYNFTNSSADERGAGGLSLNTLNLLRNRSHSLTGTISHTVSPRIVTKMSANYSQLGSRSSYLLDSFGGAVLPAASLLAQASLSNASFSADLNGRSTMLLSAGPATSTQRQFNTNGYVEMVYGNHTMQFGADFRRMFPIIGMRGQERGVLFDGVAQAITGQAALVNAFTRFASSRPVFNNFSAYAKDQWRVTPRLIINYGTRWELSPAPSASASPSALAVTQVTDPATITIAASGAKLWSTSYLNFAPRVGVAYQPRRSGDLVIRGALGVLYANRNASAGDAFADSYPFLDGSTQFNVPFAFTSSPAPNQTPISVPLSVFDPHLKVPYTIQWSASVQEALSANTSISASYVGSAGRRLLVTSTLLNANVDFPFMRLTNNSGTSRYHSLQLTFERRFARGLGAMVSYTLAKSVDNAATDTTSRSLFRSSDLLLERGPSDFDIRHTLNGFVSYDLPAAFASGWRNSLTRNWSLDAGFDIRSASPINVVYGVPTSFGFIYFRPDVIEGAPLYLRDPAAADGMRINPEAFNVPLALRQGALGRNALRGFPLSQLNFALRRKFAFTESLRLTVSAEATNVFNHPNFAAPVANDASLGTRFNPAGPLSVNQTFGQSYSNAARSGWGLAGSSFGSNYYSGGARSIRLSVKFVF